MNNTTKILSVGIDIGTSTTQVIFCYLTIKDSAGSFRVPHITITDKEIVYKSDIVLTPLLSRTSIDAQGVKDIVAKEFSKAGFTPKDISTGAVIITGETARKENSKSVLNELSNFAGDFVVSTAGPDLEAIIAGKGSGAYTYSKNTGERVVNLDIGGGTVNAVLFDGENVISKGCLDIGGRLITYDESKTITYISESAKKIATSVNIEIKNGDKITKEKIFGITDKMADLLYSWISNENSTLLSEITTKDSSALSCNKRINAICFSGGVADSIYSEKYDYDKFNDIGVYLGESIRRHALFNNYKLIKANETIRATVIGAGSHTTTVSGSTITYNKDIFPLKNIPVLKLTENEQTDCFNGNGTALQERISWLLNQSSTGNLIVALRGRQDPSYNELQKLGEVLFREMNKQLDSSLPLIVVIECDIAKALGQVMLRQMKDIKRDIICIDSIRVEPDDYVDMGRPIMDGMVIPVVVKTLAFS